MERQKEPEASSEAVSPRNSCTNNGKINRYANVEGGTLTGSFHLSKELQETNDSLKQEV